VGKKTEVTFDYAPSRRQGFGGQLSLCANNIFLIMNINSLKKMAPPAEALAKESLKTL
jgi:hypothetical protein